MEKQAIGKARLLAPWILAASGLALACALPTAQRADARQETVPVVTADASASGKGDATCGGDEAAGSSIVFRWPVLGAVTSPFGGRGRRSHQGIDIAARYGTLVRAAAAGTVVFSGRKRNYGRVVIVSHGGGYTTVYAHNQDNFAIAGAPVKQGEELAEVGTTGNATGPHLHFEVRRGDRPIDPLSCLPVRATR